MTRRCQCCQSIVGRPEVKAVAVWICSPSGYAERLCQACLDIWFDNAADDPELEAHEVRWLDGTRVLVGAT